MAAKQPLAQQGENSDTRSTKSNEYGSGDVRSNAIPYAARNKAGQLLTSSHDDADGEHLTYGGAGSSHGGFSGSSGSGSRPGSYIAPSFERNDDMTASSSYTTLPAAIGSMFTPMQNAIPRTTQQQQHSAGNRSPRDRSPARNAAGGLNALGPRRNSATRGAALGPVAVSSSARVPAGVATASVNSSHQTGSFSPTNGSRQDSNPASPRSPQQ